MSKLRLRPKLLLAFSSVALVLVAVSVLAYLRMTDLVDKYQDALEQRAQTSALLSQLAEGNYQRLAGLRGYLLDNDTTEKSMHMRGRELTARAVQGLGPLVSSRAGQKAIASLQDSFAQYDQVQDQILTLWEKQDKVGATDLLAIASGRAAAIQRQTDELRAAELAQIADEEKLLHAEAAQTEWIMLGSAGFALIWATLLALYFSGRIAGAVGKVASGVLRLSAGDLTVQELKVDRADEIGDMARAFNQMVRSLRAMIIELGTNAQRVLAASGDLSAASEQMAQAAQDATSAVIGVAQGASSQAGEASSVGATAEELQGTIQQVATGAGQSAIEVQQASAQLVHMADDLERVAVDAAGVAGGATQAAAVAHSGAVVVEQTAAGLERIRGVVVIATERVRSLQELSSQIGQITEVISTIADQTNLLALNAAIEAARAGEHGRGFAVVADHVRKLAQDSLNSAQSISTLVQTIQSHTAEASEAMEGGLAEVEQGSQLAAESGAALQTILSTAQRVATDVGSIAHAIGGVREGAQRVVQAFDTLAAIVEENTSATEEMSASATQVASSVSTIAQVAQENATAAAQVSSAMEELSASTEEVAVSAQDLARIAEQLSQQAARFRV